MEKKVRKCRLCKEVELTKGKTYCEKCRKERHIKSTHKWYKKWHKRKLKERPPRLCLMCEVKVKAKERYCKECRVKKTRIANWKYAGMRPAVGEYDDDCDWNWIFTLEKVKSCPVCGEEKPLNFHVNYNTGLIYGYACQACRMSLRSCQNNIDKMCAMISFLAPSTRSGIFACSEGYNNRDTKETEQEGDFQQGLQNGECS